MDIGPGDFVECVRDGPNKWGMPSWLKAGTIYRVRKVLITTLFLYPSAALPRPRPGYKIDRFRPIYRPKAEIIQGLLQPIKEKEDA